MICYLIAGPSCWRQTANYIHTLFTCPILKPFWEVVEKFLSNILDFKRTSESRKYSGYLLGKTDLADTHADDKDMETAKFIISLIGGICDCIKSKYTMDSGGKNCLEDDEK